MLPNGNLCEVYGRAAEKSQKVCITQLDDVLYQVDTVLDFRAVQRGNELHLNVLGDAQQAQQAVAAAFPQLQVTAQSASEEEMKFTGKRKLARQEVGG